jgi:hypothetical protein
VNFLLFGRHLDLFNFSKQIFRCAVKKGRSRPPWWARARHGHVFSVGSGGIYSPNTPTPMSGTCPLCPHYNPALLQILAVVNQLTMLVDNTTRRWYLPFQTYEKWLRKSTATISDYLLEMPATINFPLIARLYKPENSHLFAEFDDVRVLLMKRHITKLIGCFRSCEICHCNWKIWTSILWELLKSKFQFSTHSTEYNCLFIKSARFPVVKI